MKDLAADFDIFRQECADFLILVKTFETLYSNADAHAVLANAAARFFDDLRHWLVELYVVKVSRLTDPAHKGSDSNLTAAYFEEQLTDEGKCTDEVRQLNKRLKKYRQHVVNARNKRVAHNDLRSARSSLAWGTHDKSEFDAFLIDLNRFTDAVGKILGRGPLDYQIAPGEGDVSSLIHRLERKQV